MSLTEIPTLSVKSELLDDMSLKLRKVSPPKIKNLSS